MDPIEAQTATVDGREWHTRAVGRGGDGQQPDTSDPGWPVRGFAYRAGQGRHMLRSPMCMQPILPTLLYPTLSSAVTAVRSVRSRVCVGTGSQAADMCASIAAGR